MSADEFEETLDVDEADTDEADTLMIRRRGGVRRRPGTKPVISTDHRFNPWARWTKAQRDEFNRRKAARAKEIAAQVEPTNGKCPAGYHLGWALRPILLPGMAGMPAPRKVCQPDKPGTTPIPIIPVKPKCPKGQRAVKVRSVGRTQYGGPPTKISWKCVPITGYIRPPMFRVGQCGTRTEGRGITWGRILPQYRHLSRAERQAVVDKMCGRKPKPPVNIKRLNAGQNQITILSTTTTPYTAKMLCAAIGPNCISVGRLTATGWQAFERREPFGGEWSLDRGKSYSVKVSRDTTFNVSGIDFKVEVSPPIPDDAAYKELVAKYNAAKSKYNLLVTEGKTINDQYRRKKAEIAKARRALADAERLLKGIPRRIRLPDRWQLYRRRR